MLERSMNVIGILQQLRSDQVLRLTITAHQDVSLLTDRTRSLVLN